MLEIWCNRASLAGLAAAVVLGCGGPETIAVVRVGDDAEREGWIEVARPVAGDAATRFESLREGPLPGAPPSLPFFYERGFDGGPVTSVVSDHLLSLSRFRGLVSTRLSGAGAPVVEASLPLGGLPVGLSVSGGVAAVLVLDPMWSPCYVQDCPEQQTSRVVLVDVRDPASLRALGEQRFAGSVSAARSVGGALHVLAHDIVDCVSCQVAPDADFRWLTFERRVATELPPPRVAPVEGAPFFSDTRLFVLSPGALYAQTAPELRVAELSAPEPVLSAPVALAGRVQGIGVAGERLRVNYFGGASLDLETFALGAGTATSLGRGSLTLPAGESLRGFISEGGRAVSVLEPSGQLAVFDLADANVPRLASRLPLGVSEASLALAGNRVLVAGRSTLAADAAPGDVIARGPQALVLVDIADLAAPRALDRVALGGFDAVGAGLLELRGARALFSYYEAFPTWLAGAKPQGGGCGRSVQRLMGYDIGGGRLTPVFAFDGLDSDARVVDVGEDGWIVSSVSVSRYAATATAPTLARRELTRSISSLRALYDGVALFGEDFASNAPTLELAPDSIPLESADTIDVATAVGLARVGCAERRLWNTPALERNGELYALRFHLPAGGRAPAAATLHAIDIGTVGLEPQPRSLELPPLAAGEDYLGVVLADRALLIARGRRDDAPNAPGYDPRSLFRVSDTDPTLFPQSPNFSGVFQYSAEEGLHPAAKLGYDVVDLSDPAGPALASRLEIDPALATGGFLRSLRGVTRDTAWGFHTEGLVSGPAVVSGSIVVGQHSEPVRNGLFRFQLDRLDVSNPAAPIQLPSVEIPGSVLDFDARTGELLTLEWLRVREPSGAQRALNALMVDDNHATRVGRLLLDTAERKVVSLAVSHGRVYYTTQPWQLASDSGEAALARDATLERVVLRDGRFVRLPSLDVTAVAGLVPARWEQFAARGDRALWVSRGRLSVADFSGAEPRVETHDIGPWGCAWLDLRGDDAYCAQGQAGYVRVKLGQP